MEQPLAADVRSALSGLRRVVRSLRVASRAAEKALGISGAQLFVLHELQRRPGASLKELAALTLTDQSSVSVVASRLVTRGLVTRRAAADDGRRAELALTHTAESLLRDGPEPVQRHLIAALESLDRRDVRIAAKVLSAIATHLDAEEDAPMFFEDEGSPTRPRAKRKPRARS